jgi:cytochrome P450
MMNFSIIDKSAMEFFASLTRRLYEERKGRTSNTKIKDFLQLMIDAEEEMDNMKTEGSLGSSTNKSITMDELVAQGILFFIAGYDTTGTSISHALYFLSKYPECQEKLLQELKTLEKVDIDSLTELKYLDAVIQETLRLAPPLPRIERHCIKDHQLGDTGILIEAGMQVSVDAYSLQRDPNYFKDPNTFNPERYIDQTNLALMTFGGGPRLCVGMRFAMNEMRMCLAKLIKNFRFSISEETKVKHFIMFF